MNLEEILQQINVQLGNGAGEIDWEDDETLARITLANSGILTWATAQNTPWTELQKDISLGEIQVGENEFELPKEIRKIEKIFIGNFAHNRTFGAIAISASAENQNRATFGDVFGGFEGFFKTIWRVSVINDYFER